MKAFQVAQMIHKYITRGFKQMVGRRFNNHYNDLPAVRTCNIDTLEIVSPFIKINIFMNSNLLSCFDKGVAQRALKKRESNTYLKWKLFFGRVRICFPTCAKPYTYSKQSNVNETYNITLSKYKESKITFTTEGHAKWYWVWFFIWFRQQFVPERKLKYRN